MKLLLDIGNTRLKCAYVSTNKLISVPPLVHREQQFNSQLLQQWQALTPIPNQIAISCVGASEVLEQVLSIARQLWPTVDIIIPKAKKFALGVHNAYKYPEKLGVDRWLALLAVRQIYREPACVVDCGTAITLDFMAADGQHSGGLICPGLTLMKQALARGTEQLKFTQIRYAPGLADYTEAAIYSGTLYAAAGLIEKVLTAQPGIYKLFLTGGDAELVASQLNITSTINPDLVLYGLLAISNEDSL